MTLDITKYTYGTKVSYRYEGVDYNGFYSPFNGGYLVPEITSLGGYPQVKPSAVTDLVLTDTREGRLA